MMRVIIGADEPTPEGRPTGFDAVHTLSATAILAGIARGDAFACALLRLHPQFDGTFEPRDESRFAAELDLARRALQAGRPEEVAERLLAFLCFEAAAAPALALLAEACLGADRVADAHAVVTRCLEGAPHHPTALRVAGEVELARGNRKAAKGHFAKAARIARKLPEHVEDMRIAQRLLLQMQFG